jgi:hypothetical protein
LAKWINIGALALLTKAAEGYRSTVAAQGETNAIVAPQELGISGSLATV